jgi:hypothetical protein
VTIPIPLAIAGMLLTAVFSAGGAIVTLRFLQKDVNGLGARVRRLEVAMLTLVADDKREWLAWFLQR